MNRRDALKILTLGGSGALAMSLSDLKKFADAQPASALQPSLFIGHGSPMNALFNNNFTQSLNTLGKRLEKPKAVLVVSAHWLTRGTFVSTSPDPETIYDFGGFPKELFEVNYPAKGAPKEALSVIETVKSIQIHEDHDMGLDHGAWTVLKHIWPDADVPVFQLSIDFYKSPQWHYALAQELKALRSKGIMILTSGNITHNLGRVNFNDINASPVDWALEFDNIVKKKIDSRDDAALEDYLNLGTAARSAVPTNDHYLPLLYTLGTTDKKEELQYTFEGFQYGSISMRCLQIG